MWRANLCIGMSLLIWSAILVLNYKNDECCTCWSCKQLYAYITSNMFVRVESKPCQNKQTSKAYPFFGLTKMAIHAWQVSLNYLHFAADHHWMNSERFLFCGCHVMLLVIPCELPWPGLVGFPTNKFRATNKFTSQVLLLVGKKKMLVVGPN